MDPSDITEDSNAARKNNWKIWKRKKCGSGFYDALQIGLLIAAVAAGIIVGTILRLCTETFSNPELHPREMMYLYFPAELFLRFIYFITVPFMVSSLVSGIGSLDASQAGKLGVRGMVYYVLTTMLAVTEGFIFVYTIKPGSYAQGATVANSTTQPGEMTPDPDEHVYNGVDTALDMIRNLFPDNIVKACTQLYSTHVTMVNLSLSNGNNASVLQVESFRNVPVDSMNVLGLAFHSILFGLGLVFIGEKGRILIDIFDALFAVFLKMALFALWLYPVAVFSMVACSVVQVQDPLGLMQKMLAFIITTLAAQLFHSLITLPLIFFIFVRKNPYKHLLRCGKALLTAFVTANSSMTIPVTMQCLERAGIHRSVIRFMVPIGATVNMDGLALYEANACIFIATLNGMNPGPAEILTLGLTAVVLSIGNPTSTSGVFLFFILFKTIGLPVSDIALLVPMDWILMKLRTSVNVWGDCIGAGVVHATSKADFQHLRPDVDSYANEQNRPIDVKSDSNDDVMETEHLLMK